MDAEVNTLIKLITSIGFPSLVALLLLFWIKEQLKSFQESILKVTNESNQVILELTKTLAGLQSCVESLGQQVRVISTSNEVSKKILSAGD